ncbi:MAG: helix-turn-helix transcriptional regulator [Dehalococcoidia bacterium]
MFGKKRPSVNRQQVQIRQSRMGQQKPVDAIALIKSMRERAGLTAYGLAERARVDSRYLTRLESGESRNPGREVLIQLGRTLVRYTKNFNEKDVDAVLAAAGYPPAPDPVEQSCSCGRYSG